MLDQDKGMADRGCCGHKRACVFKRGPYLHSDKRFILDNED